MSGKTIRIAIIEDECLVAEALQHWLEHQAGCTLVAQASNAAEGRSACLAARPDLALVDLQLPDTDGIDLALDLMAELPGIRILAMSGITDPYPMWRVSQSGIHGFIDKTQNLDQLRRAIEVVMAGGTFFSAVFEEVRDRWLSQPEAFQKVLSTREQEVLRRVVVGWNDERIAKKLSITPSTVAFHRKSIRRKLGLHNDRDLIAYGRLWGFR